MILCSYHMLVLVEKEKQPCLFCLSRRYLFSSRFQLLPITGLHFYFKIALSFPLLKLTYPPPPPPPTTFELSPSVAVLPTPTSVGHKGRFGSEFLLLHLPPPPKSALLLRHLSLSLAPAPSRASSMKGYYVIFLAGMRSIKEVKQWMGISNDLTGNLLNIRTRLKKPKYGSLKKM
ncbi:hypothetical protein L2E82_06616 [Cichorium intybus]|uniref:Uncharacterized protein n=1 Tax=Cichorium intybus TaxID=13427 RepID=A0ACB9HA13_CICIN|nr:hypothetical protein L2E82_06616 [Cichorium intybus]